MQAPAENGNLLMLTFISQSLVHLFLCAHRLMHVTLSSLHEVPKDFEGDLSMQ